MTLKDILVHVDVTESSAERLNTAINLAKANGARLTGIYVKTKPYIPGYAEAQIAAEVVQEQAKKEDEAAKEAGEKFQAAVGSNDLETGWRVLDGEVTNIIAEQARFYDLVVVGQCDPDSKIFMGDCDMPDRLITESGRPALVIPYVGKYGTIGKHILVAWDGSPVAARAVHDAMSLLEMAEKVTVMVINPEDDNDEKPEFPAADIADHLERHGINVETDSVKTDIKTADMLLSRASDLGADMIVMGAYGHARWAELMMGGVTEHILSHMTVPVLMSH